MARCGVSLTQSISFLSGLRHDSAVPEVVSISAGISTEAEDSVVLEALHCDSS